MHIVVSKRAVLDPPMLRLLLKMDRPRLDQSRNLPAAKTLAASFIVVTFTNDTFQVPFQSVGMVALRRGLCLPNPLIRFYRGRYSFKGLGDKVTTSTSVKHVCSLFQVNTTLLTLSTRIQDVVEQKQFIGAMRNRVRCSGQ